MPVNISYFSPGTINVLNSDWSVKLDAVPHSPLLQNGTTGEVDYSCHSSEFTNLVMNNGAVFNYTSPYADPDTGINYNGTTLIASNPGVISTTLSGVIDSVNSNSATTSYTQGTQFTQFATTDVDIPWVSSGSVLAAIDLAWQLAGNSRCKLNYERGRYWSLRGHDSGFDNNNKIFYPADYSTYRLNPANDGTYYRNWDLRDAFAGNQWNAVGNATTGYGADLYCFNATGSSPSVVSGTRTSIAFYFPTSGTGVNFFYGTNPGDWNDQANGYSQQWGFGPRIGGGATGKTMYFSVSSSSKNCAVYMVYGNSTTNQYSVISQTVDLSSLNWATSQRLKIVTDTMWISDTSFQWSLWFQDYTGARVAWNSGVLTTNRDAYAKPWASQGNLHGLYQITSPNSFDPTVLLPDYENKIPLDTTLWNATDNGGLPTPGTNAYEPILPYTGSLWDYLSQVCTAKEKDFRILNGRFYVSNQIDTVNSPKNWAAITEPSMSIDNQNVSDTVEIDAQLISLKKQPIIYDARQDGNQVYSFNAGQVSQFTINSAFVGSVVMNPEPVYSYSDFVNYTPFGGYIISGADDLPIPAAQWVNSGGSVLIRQTGAQTLEVTVNCPVIVTANGDGGATASNIPSYYFGVSDGQNQYGIFTLAGGTGDVIQPVTATFQTGSSFAAGNSSPGTITNPCATSYGMVNTLASQAASVASGPNLVLSGNIPFQSLQNWVLDFGLVPGNTFYYRNVQWRLLSATFQEGSVGFTATPILAYSSPAWSINWGSKTVDDFTAYWAGKTHDDMKIMILSSPDNDWTDIGQVRKYSYGEGAVSFTGSGTLSAFSGALYPGSSTYPGNSTYPIDNSSGPTVAYPNSTLYSGPTIYPGSS